MCLELANCSIRAFSCRIERLPHVAALSTPMAGGFEDRLQYTLDVWIFDTDFRQTLQEVMHFNCDNSILESTMLQVKSKSICWFPLRPKLNICQKSMLIVIPPTLWATGGLTVVSGKITPLPTLSPGLRFDPLGSVAGEHRFRQTLLITKREPPKVRCQLSHRVVPLHLSYSRWGFCGVGGKR